MERLICAALQLAPESTAADIRRIKRTVAQRQMDISLRTLTLAGEITVSHCGAHESDHRYMLAAAK